MLLNSVKSVHIVSVDQKVLVIIYPEIFLYAQILQHVTLISAVDLHNLFLYNACSAV